MRILSVDDNSENLYLIEMLARAHGHEVTSARNGVEALARLEEGNIDLIVSDVLMPAMDGFQLCRTVKRDERFHRIPFIFYTATYTSRQDEEFGLALGASRFIVKPLDPEQFLAIVETVMKESASGALPVPTAPPDDGIESLSGYNERLVRKLEQKVRQLETARGLLAENIEAKNREIEQRQRAEEALAASEEQLRLMWEGSTDGMRITDRDGIIVRANPALAHMFNQPLEGLAGKPFTVCYQLDDPEATLRRYRERVDTRSIEPSIETVLQRWDGERLWLEGSNATIERPTGPLVFSVLRNVTSRKRTELERASLEDQLRQAQKLESVGRLAGGIAHDFNNLLTVINGYSGMLLARLDPADPMRRSIGEVLKAGERAAGLTRQLLTFSRKQSVDLKPLNLTELVAGSASMIQRLVGDDMMVFVSVPPTVAMVKADAGQLQQVLMNLVVNARDAMPHGGKLQIELSSAQVERPEQVDCAGLTPGAYALLKVADSGTGMDAATRQRVFEPFFTTKEEGKGTGLGLSIVYGIVRQCGGAIALDTAPGRGSTFRIYLPLLNSSTEANPGGPAADRALHGEETILLVEDHDQVRAVTAQILRSCGYRVIEASSSEDAVTVARQMNEPINLLLTDIQMPHGTGTELAERVRRLRAGMRVLYMSGAVGEAVSPQIAKPFSRTDLAAKVREVLGTMERPAR